MDIERPHRTTSTPTTTSELFICFTSRLSKSSSMRLSSKSILSPARTTDKSAQPLSLSTSLSRRLRHNGSLRGGQSPAMFPSKKNRGSSGFADNPEPSSPKVTCIGQVRVKTKKQGKKMKMRACRSKRLSGGEASFRRIEHPHEGGLSQTQECGLNHRNQRWVHLPLTICEALRAFGNEFSCLFPCKSSCFSSGSACGGEKGGKTGEKRESSTNSCAVFRWLVSLQEAEGEGKRRDIELVVGGEEVTGESIMMERECSRRRSIFDDMEFDDLFNNVKNEGEIDNDNDDEEEGARVSICIPPKNALLLMRCRSDPMKMASLSHKLWEAPMPQKDDEDDDEREESEMKEVKLEEKIEVKEDKREEIGEEFVEGEKIDGVLDVWVEVESSIEDLACFVGEEDQEETIEEEQETEEKQGIENTEEHRCETPEETLDESLENAPSIEMVTVEEKVENEQDLNVNLEEHQEQVKEEEGESSEIDQLCSEVLVEKSSVVILERDESSDLTTTITTSSSNSAEESTAESKEEEEKDTLEVEEEEEKDPIEVEQKEEQVLEARKSMEEKPKEERENNTKPTLPDCLLLMMCEPKVSMEVSKETWVCSTDFIRWLPERPSKKVGNKLDASDECAKKKKPPVQPSLHTLLQRSEPGGQPPVQPARSSISFPAGGGSVANMIEQKLVTGGGCEPLVLTRCKSAPMRSAAAKIAPSEMTCSLWGRENGRKLEPHRPATFGFGAAGVGF